MSSKTKIEKDFKNAFNIGYELAKELNLQSPMFSDSKDMSPMQAGMKQYCQEIDKNKGMDLTI